ncbi:MAG: DUF5362 family protein [Bacteroidota bacterium]
MENQESLNNTENKLTFNNEMLNSLKEVARWGNFLAIVGYVGLSLMILASLFMFAAGGFSNHLFPGGNFPGFLAGFLYIIVAVLYFFPVNYLYKASDQIKKAIAHTNEAEMTAGFAHLNSLFRFMGIMTIVVLSIYALVIVVAIFAALLS